MRREIWGGGWEPTPTVWSLVTSTATCGVGTYPEGLESRDLDCHLWVNSTDGRSRIHVRLPDHLRNLRNLRLQRFPGSDQVEGDQGEEHAGDADQGFADGPGAEGLAHGETEAFLHDPESGVVEMRQEEGTASDGHHDQGAMVHVEIDALGAEVIGEEQAGGGDGDGGGAGGDADEGGDEPAEEKG